MSFSNNRNEIRAFQLIQNNGKKEALKIAKGNVSINSEEENINELLKWREIEELITKQN